jgi:hypothetical protein
MLIISLLGVIIITGIYASGIVFYDAPVVLCFNENYKTYWTLNNLPLKLELGPHASAFSAMGTLILCSSSSETNID